MRQLLISDGTAVSYTNNVLAAGALDIVKRSADGHTSLAPGDTITNSDEIRFVQGTGVKNIFSPWIPGKSIKAWMGNVYTAQVAQVSTLTFATAATAAGEMSVKLISTENGQQFKRKNVTINVTAGQTANNIALAVMSGLTGIATGSLVTATPYPIVGVDYATVSMTIPGAVIVITGTTYSETALTELGSWRTAEENLDGSNGTTLAVAATATPSLGYGNAHVLRAFEKSLQGNKSYYNRVFLPNEPTLYTVLTDTYDVYSLSFDNPAQNQINGVDNVREIAIAYKDGGAGQTAFEGKINPYVGSCPGTFASVTL